MILTVQAFKDDLKQAIKEKNNFKRDGIRLILGEIARLDTKEPTEQQIVKIIKKLITSETEVHRIAPTSDGVKYIDYLKGCLPELLTRQEIIDYIIANVDFTQLKNKMQAVGIVTKSLGSKVDGKMVSEIVKEKF